MNTRTQEGQGIIELIISIGIIMASVVTTLGLVISTTSTSSASKAQILAANLAREGIEVARSVRDSNWLAVDSGIPGAVWNKSLSQGGVPDDHTAIAQFQPSIGQWSLLFNADDTDDTQAQLYLHPVSGIFAQFENPSELLCPSGEYCNFQPINYWRLLSLNPVCWYRDPSTGLEAPVAGFPEQIVADDTGATCAVFGADYVQVGIEVRSRVRWLEKGKPHNIEVIEKIFNWKT